MNKLTIEPSGGGVGAFVSGIDLNGKISADDISSVRNALGDHGVLFLRNQKISSEHRLR
jgi:alpha-ketoglutarate-dependent taurine dioxygenase